MHEIFEVIFVVNKSAAEVISEVDSDDQPNGWRKAECYQAGIRVDTIGRRILRNSVAVYCPHHIRCDDRFQETTTGKGRPHRTLELEGRRARIPDADRLPEYLAVARVTKQECTERPLAKHEESEQGPKLVHSQLLDCPVG